MRRLATIGATLARELIGLFFDGGILAPSIIAWLAAASIVLPRLKLPALWRAPLLSAGLLVILVGTCLHAIARHRGRR